MQKEKVHLQTFSGQEKIVALIQKVTPPVIIFCAIILGCTSTRPWLAVPLILMAPAVGIGFSKYGLKKKRSMRWPIALINGTLVFIVCTLSGKNSPSFILGFTNLLFVTIFFKNPLEKAFQFVFSFSIFIVGSLLSEMDHALIVEGTLCLLIYAVILNQVLVFVIVQGNEIANAKTEIEHQKEMIEEKQKEIIDSITYARRIQRALLPTEMYMDKNLRKLIRE